MKRLWLMGLCSLALWLGGCGGGGNSSVTTITGGGTSGQGTGPVVGVDFVQQVNNLQVVVDNGPDSAFTLGVANVLYASVTVCAPDSGQTRCQTIDHVQVDTGSVGLRVLASKVKSLGLPPVALAPDPISGVAPTTHECYPFVIGGLWGPNAVADVGLGQQWATAVPIQLIEDDPAALLTAPQNCVDASNGQVLSSVSSLGSNGILGIGSVMLDCGLTCQSGNYSNTYVQYYSCPPTANSMLQCSPTAVDAAHQVFNPVAALPTDNNGILLNLPAVSGLGASRVNGELIFGINTRSNNQIAPGAPQVHLGIDWVGKPDSYLNVSTLYNNQLIANSYLDTGTNALFFNDTSVNRCVGSTWYCPGSVQAKTATLSDGDLPSNNPVNVAFSVLSADVYFSTSNVAFSGLAGAPGASAVPSFSWGLPFFFGRRVFLSIWQKAGAEAGPWYSF